VYWEPDAWSNPTLGVTVNLAAATATDNWGNTDTLVSIENVQGSPYADTLIGDAGNNLLEGGNGDDFLDGGAGLDTAAYSSSIAPVTVNLSLTGSQNTGGAGIDTLVNVENLQGSAYADTLLGDAAITV